MVNGYNKPGIDKNSLSSHSIRAASTSKAKISGIPTKEILKKAFWSTSSTLRGFIVRKLLSISKIFKEQFWPRNICSVL